MRRLVLMLLLLLAPSLARSEERVPFDAAEVGKILAHGPWPSPAKRDPSNRFSGTPSAIAFGRRLFFDEGLSRFGALSCASCHKPDKAWGDGRARASAAASLDRNTPALFNLRHMTWFGWDGGADSLWMQSVRPILDAREMAASPAHIRSHIAGQAALRSGYRRVTGHNASRQPAGHVLVNVAKALAAFQETLTTGRTPFDDFRDALAMDDHAARAAYPMAAQRGLKLFVGRGNCSSCHAGPIFTDSQFHDIGLDTTSGPGRIDSGRQGGLEKLKASPYTLLSRFNDDATRSLAAKTRAATAASAPATGGAFRVPPLRNVALTAPYMHNGSKTTLAEAVRHSASRDADQAPRLDLSAGEIADLVAFLESLTEAPKR